MRCAEVTGKNWIAIVFSSSLCRTASVSLGVLLVDDPDALGDRGLLEDLGHALAVGGAVVDDGDGLFRDLMANRAGPGLVLALLNHSLHDAGQKRGEVV